MDDVKRKALSQLLRSPSTVIPLAFGAAAFGMSALIDSTAGRLIGAANFLASLGVTATRWIMSIDRLQEEARRRLLRSEEQKHRDEMKQLEASLVLDGDARTESCLRQLCDHYDMFQEKAHDASCRRPDIR
ncbi:MAG: hypothetical protein CMJ64_06245 [Planctomycetaceae bacterium]|nr:hypothetical protein [Planctomycetaceae bacterium]